MKTSGCSDGALVGWMCCAEGETADSQSFFSEATSLPLTNRPARTAARRTGALVRTDADASDVTAAAADGA